MYDPRTWTKGGGDAGGRGTTMEGNKGEKKNGTVIA